MKIVWSKRSINQLKKISDFLILKTKSETISQKVILEIVRSAEILKTQPLINKIDDLKINNDGSYRFYEIYSFRVSYKISKENIRILRIRHGRRKPIGF